MREIEGLVESFKEAKMVYLTTFRDGEERSRQMTNFNEDPYDVIWFPSDMKSRKVEDIKRAPKNQLIEVAFTFFLIERIERLRDEPPAVHFEPEQA